MSLVWEAAIFFLFVIICTSNCVRVKAWAVYAFLFNKTRFETNEMTTARLEDSKRLHERESRIHAKNADSAAKRVRDKLSDKKYYFI